MIKMLCSKVSALASHTFSVLDLDFFPNDQALPSTTVVLRLIDIACLPHFD